MPRPKRAEEYVTIELRLPKALKDRLDETLTPSGFSAPPLGQRQRILIRLIRDFCDEQDHIRHNLTLSGR